MFSLTLVRHGETPCNVANIVQSRTGGELTQRGTNMAKSLGKHIKNESFTRIYCSDLQRCRDTLGNMMDHMSTLLPEVQYTELLRERDYGDWEFLPGKVTEEKILEMNLPNHKRHRVEVPNGETYAECRKRAARFFSDILQIVDESEDNAEENILAVSHGAFIMCFLDHLVENPAVFEIVNLGEEQLKQSVFNTCRTKFSISKLKPGDTQKRRVTFTHFLNTEHYKFMETL